MSRTSLSLSRFPVCPSSQSLLPEVGEQTELGVKDRVKARAADAIGSALSLSPLSVGPPSQSFLPEVAEEDRVPRQRQRPHRASPRPPHRGFLVFLCLYLPSLSAPRLNPSFLKSSAPTDRLPYPIRNAVHGSQSFLPEVISSDCDRDASDPRLIKKSQSFLPEVISSDTASEHARYANPSTSQSFLPEVISSDLWWALFR